MTTKKVNSMLGINSYGRELNQDDIAKNVHRGFIGGLWGKLGKLQLEFLKEHGLQPDHKLLDIGCGCLRGGLHFMRYLETGNYYGIDINRSLIEAGVIEVKKEGLEGRLPTLLVDNHFRLEKFGEKFDYMVSVSLFTHLPMNIINRCLSKARRQLKQEGVYFATFFEAPYPVHLDNITQVPGEIVSEYDADPFHYSFEELSWMGAVSGFNTKLIGDWKHPRNQKMAAFTLST